MWKPTLGKSSLHSSLQVLNPFILTIMVTFGSILNRKNEWSMNQKNMKGHLHICQCQWGWRTFFMLTDSGFHDTSSDVGRSCDDDWVESPEILWHQSQTILCPYIINLNSAEAKFKMLRLQLRTLHCRVQSWRDLYVQRSTLINSACLEFQCSTILATLTVSSPCLETLDFRFSINYPCHFSDVSLPFTGSIALVI